jgi:hypothetical protein
MWRVGLFWKKLVHNSNKRGVGGGKKSKKSINMEGGFFLWRVEFFKINKRDFTFIREMRVTSIDDVITLEDWSEKNFEYKL